MPRMKHLLRKLHIGGGGIDDQHHRLGENRARTSTSPSSGHGLIPNSDLNQPSSSVSSSSAFATMGEIAVAAEPIGDRTVAFDQDVDYNVLEEEFQVQLALAISASDPADREDLESAQINAAKQISLSCDAAVTDWHPLVQFQSLRYWNYNLVDYGEKVKDGFYDACHIASNSIVQGKMPLLVDLQRMSMFGNVDYEVILVDRLLDPELQQLESRACALATECVLVEEGTLLSGLLQKVADLVVNRMGGPVDDAEEMLRRWNIRRRDLCDSRNTVILPIGCLDLGLSRHRALLFKVLADKVNIPCMLVKGSYYTGTDDGAVNLIKIDNGSEYIIDLMGAPGALIPAEVPTCQLQNSGFNIRGYAEVLETPNDSQLVLDGGSTTPPTVLSDVDKGYRNGRTMYVEEASLTVLQNKEDTYKYDGRNQTERPDMWWLQEQCLSCDRSLQENGKIPSPQEMQVRNVSEYVLTAAKDPEFAQKLHAVLLESGASPPLDLFSDINSQLIREDKANEKHVQVTVKTANNWVQSDINNLLTEDVSLLSTPGVCFKSTSEICEPADLCEQQKGWVSSDGSIPYGNTHSDFMPVGGGISKAVPCDDLDFDGVQINVGMVSDNTKSRRDHHIQSEELNNEHNDSCKWVNEALAEALEWEIPWEDLHIGERIGIGSCGEVYRADWNGTEVAVKKFLDQDFSGDALVQFKYEVEIMLRLRHPNVVLFMGAITRPPHFSILTEFIPRGSLYRLLHRPNSQLDERRRICMALDVAKGMNYLHTSHPTIVHRDLKSPNLLVDKSWIVKVCDFGLSRMKNHTFLSSKSTAGTPEWMAPEVLRNEPANEKCDVYSFGVILWELATLQVPWKGLNPMQVVGAVGFQDRRLEIPVNVNPSVAEIIRDCWQREPHLRPSFARLMSRLRSIHRLVERPDLTNHSEYVTGQRQW